LTPIRSSNSTKAVSSLRVRLIDIGRTSTFTYKGQAVHVKQIGRELGVRFVLEESVRKSGDRVRITAQLIDAATDANLWADHLTLEVILPDKPRRAKEIAGGDEHRRDYRPDNEPVDTENRNATQCRYEH
jgi:hypothetical protein